MTGAGIVAQKRLPWEVNLSLWRERTRHNLAAGSLRLLRQLPAGQIFGRYFVIVSLKGTTAARCMRTRFDRSLSGTTETARDDDHGSPSWAVRRSQWIRLSRARMQSLFTVELQT